MGDMALAIAITTLLLFTVAFRGSGFVAAETNPMRLGLSRVNMAVAEGEDLAMKYNITLSKPLPDNVAYHVTIRDNSHPACEGQLDITPRAIVLKGNGNSYATVSVRRRHGRHRVTFGHVVMWVAVCVACNCSSYLVPSSARAWCASWMSVLQYWFSSLGISTLL